MRIRTLAAAISISLALGLLSAAPASAAYSVQSITFPGGADEFYSPFGGPATIEFAFLGTEPNATFNLRLRPAGGTAIHTRDVFVTADEPDGTETETFSWPALTVNSARLYVVAVYRNGKQIASDSFFLHPPLARVTGAAPNPFFPWIDDGHRDTTNVAFSLQADAAAEARVFRPNANGNCCGPLILDESLGNRSAGPNSWVWDGQGEGEHAAAGNRPAGGYFVRIWADDTGPTPPAVSKAFKVTIARTYRATATKSKPGTQFHHTTESALVRGGDCFTHAQGGYLQVDCHGARMTVFYRWGLGSAQRIEKASFVIDNSNSECGAPRRKPGHSQKESFLTVTDAVSGITSCRIVTARITYSFPKAS